MLILESPTYQLSIDPESAAWSLYGKQRDSPYLENASMGVYYRAEGEGSRSIETGQHLLPEAIEGFTSPDGDLRQVHLQSPADSRGASASVTFALPQSAPLLLIKLRLENRGGSPIRVDRLEVVNAGFSQPLKRGFLSVLLSRRSLHKYTHTAVRLHPDPGETLFFSNGWQSWSFSGVYGPGDRMFRSRLGLIRDPVDARAAVPRQRREGWFTSEMFGFLADCTHRTGILAGFLSQKKQFGSIEAVADRFAPALRVWANGEGIRLDPGRAVETDWACIQFLDLDSADPLAAYLEAVRLENLPPRGQGEAHQRGFFTGSGEIPTGWCSWYHFFDRLTGEDIRRNLEAVRRLGKDAPLQVVQIDDGFETFPGDWFDFKPGFPGGVEPLSREIRAAGKTPGLWLAPFVAHPRSRLRREHPDWLLRSGRLGYARIGFIWNTFPLALDLTVPEALDYAAGTVRTACREWGFPYLKLDFLYAAAVRGKYRDPTLTSAQVLRRGLEVLREAAGDDAYLVGCGCPLGSALGLVDAMRVSTDVAPSWYPSQINLAPLLRGEMTLPATGYALHNTFERAFTHNRWWTNDPDCLMLRQQMKLSLTEVQTLASVIALTGGSLLVSDHLPDVPPDRLKILSACLPPMGRKPWLADWLDSRTPGRVRLDLENPAGSWALLGLFNWDDQPRDLTLRLEEFKLDSHREYFARSFWDARTFRVRGEQVFRQVAAHGAVILAVRPCQEDEPLYLGSDLHISGGLELVAWRMGSGSLTFRLERPGTAEGSFDLYLPAAPLSAGLNNDPLLWVSMPDGTYRFKVKFSKFGEVEVRYA